MKNQSLKKAFEEAQKSAHVLPTFVVKRESAKSLMDREGFFVRTGCYSDLESERVNSFDSYKIWRESLTFCFKK